jgi:hypothetical protein
MRGGWLTKPDKPNNPAVSAQQFKKVLLLLHLFCIRKCPIEGRFLISEIFHRGEM